jgi:processive 1,2-diacylglycerol beta-glucosyltransferase
MKIIVFYASYGGGHLSAASSIKQYIEEHYLDVDVRLVDCVNYINKGIDKISTGAYKSITRNAPAVWGEIYKLAKDGPIANISATIGKQMSRKILKLFDEFQPYVVISCHPLGNQMTSYLKQKGKTNCILATVMTDFASHNKWLVGNEYVNHIFVSHEGMKREIVSKGIPESKVHATGIPLSNRFLQHFDRAEIKKSFNLDLNKKTILFFGGGEFGLGKDKTVHILQSFIENIGSTYQIIAIAGKNEKMQDKFNSIVKENNAEANVFVTGFTNQVPELMSISDLVVTKPGGLTTTESLASGLPMIVINPIPGQEVENTVFLEDKGVAIWVKDDEESENKIANILSNPEELAHMKIRSKLLAKKNSTKDICETILGKSQI